jgi:hypothetical protein
MGLEGQFTGGLTDPVISKGIMKNYICDRRLFYYPPPYFPSTNLLDMIYWQEVYRTGAAINGWSRDAHEKNTL